MDQIIDIATREISNVFHPTRKAGEMKVSSSESPVTKMFRSADGQWLAAVNCFGDIYVFNLEVQRYAIVNFLYWSYVVTCSHL
jgi:U3 small nucleolar RNA-associated protein 4